MSEATSASTGPGADLQAYPLTVPLDMGQLRIRRDDDGELWFVAKDVCDALGYANDTDAVKRHVDPEDYRDGVVRRDSIGRRQRMTEINESGLYSLTLRSRKPEAKRFKRKVTSEILPTIRKTGSYGTQQAAQIKGLRAWWLANHAEIRRQLAELEAPRPPSPAVLEAPGEVDGQLFVGRRRSDGCCLVLRYCQFGDRRCWLVVEDSSTIRYGSRYWQILGRLVQ